MRVFLRATTVRNATAGYFAFGERIKSHRVCTSPSPPSCHPEFIASLSFEPCITGHRSPYDASVVSPRRRENAPTRSDITNSLLGRVSYEISSASLVRSGEKNAR